MSTNYFGSLVEDFQQFTTDAFDVVQQSVINMIPGQIDDEFADEEPVSDMGNQYVRADNSTKPAGVNNVSATEKAQRALFDPQTMIVLGVGVVVLFVVLKVR